MSDVDLSALNGNFKEAYADKIKDNVPNYAYILKHTTMKKGAKLLGDKYNMPVKMSSGQGYTYNADGTVFSLVTPQALQIENAQVSAFSLVRQDNIGWTAISRSAGTNAFTRVMDLTIDDMTEGSGFRLECSYLHGQRGIGTTASSSNIGATSTSVTLTAASWASGIWYSALQGQLYFYRNDSGALVSSGADAIFTVTNITSSTYTLTITGTSTGIAALDIAIAASATGCNITFAGSFGANNTTYVEGTGLLNIFSNAGVLFALSGVTYPTWTGNTYSASSGPITFGKLEKSIVLPGDRGLAGKDCTVLLPLTTFADVLTEQAAARRYGDVKSKKMDNGADALEFYSPSGTMDLVPHPLMKRGEAVLFPTDEVFRIGSTDLTFQLPGQEEGTYIMSAPIAGKAGYFTSIYSDNTVASDVPSHGCLISGIIPRS